MAGVNKVILVGNLGKDPEVRHLEGGAVVAKFPLATSESYKDKSGQRIEQTEWHNIVVWRGLAEVAEKYLKKGMTIYVEGKLRTRSWDDKDNNKHYITEVVGDTFTILSKRESNPPSGNIDDTNSYNKTGNDLPF
jgi:single-strand DNA-binding protein